VHAGRKGLGKYLKSVYVKSLLLSYQLTHQLAQTFVCRSQCVLPSVINYFFPCVFLQSNAIYRVSQKSPYVYLFLRFDLCVHVPSTGNSMNVRMVAELECITFQFDAVPWQKLAVWGLLDHPVYSAHNSQRRRSPPCKNETYNRYTVEPGYNDTG